MVIGDFRQGVEAVDGGEDDEVAPIDEGLEEEVAGRKPSQQGGGDVLIAGERIYNLERWYNNQAGFGKGSDTLPVRYTTEASKEKGSEGHVCELDKMLEEYYKKLGTGAGGR